MSDMNVPGWVNSEIKRALDESATVHKWTDGISVEIVTRYEESNPKRYELLVTCDSCEETLYVGPSVTIATRQIQVHKDVWHTGYGRFYHKVRDRANLSHDYHVACKTHGVLSLHRFSWYPKEIIEAHEEEFHPRRFLKDPTVKVRIESPFELSDSGRRISRQMATMKAYSMALQLLHGPKEKPEEEPGYTEEQYFNFGDDATREFLEKRKKAPTQLHHNDLDTLIDVVDPVNGMQLLDGETYSIACPCEQNSWIVLKFNGGELDQDMCRKCGRTFTLEQKAPLTLAIDVFDKENDNA